MSWYGDKKKQWINLSLMNVEPFDKPRHWSLLCCGYPENRRIDPYKPNERVEKGNSMKNDTG